jgi:glycosyltransferase involved in cell wall biosynthesis
MGKTKGHVPKLRKKYYPMVSVCTPTFNRRPFIPTMLQCFKNQTYPKDRMEWIIVDDGTDPVGDIIEAAGISQIRYIRSEKHMKLGEKRNFMHTFCKGSIIVYMDDDDYYPPERVEHAVDVLQADRNAMCAGSSEIYVYFKPSTNPLIGDFGKMIQCGPYGPNHATAGTFAFRIELLKETRYEDGAALAEEKHFLKNYTVPFAQLDPMKSILVFSHNHNTFDKRKLLENANPQFLKDSAKTVDDFIRTEKEASIKQFFMNDVDPLLENYSPGRPEMKPDVLDQIKRIEAERQQQQQNGAQNMIMANINGQERHLDQQEIVNMLNGQIQEIRRLSEENAALKNKIAELEMNSSTE